jgi:hypothetical protein
MFSLSGLLLAFMQYKSNAVWYRLKLRFGQVWQIFGKQWENNGKRFAGSLSGLNIGDSVNLNGLK